MFGTVVVDVVVLKVVVLVVVVVGNIVVVAEIVVVAGMDGRWEADGGRGVSEGVVVRRIFGLVSDAIVRLKLQSGTEGNVVLLAREALRLGGLKSGVLQRSV